jgi:serine/threonine protein kinase/predicted negative regulator of RcsB-dependent stress response
MPAIINAGGTPAVIFMNPERWQQIENIFQEAADLPPEEQNQFLDKACGTDSELRKEVQALLANAGYGPDSNLIQAISEISRSLPLSPDRLNQIIGVYRIIEKIGQGGMGTVYRAIREDQGFKVEVALKLLTNGIHNELLQAKFRSERGILARLEHPNIARFLDGGNADDGTPFFAMEFVDGLPITEYCRTNNLSVTERLELFRNVCAAVQYLHQNLIIHRDLKPSNILVTKDRVPKLLDFGIAKLLSTEFDVQGVTQTQTVLRMMTPDFASPEQVLGLPITTSSDIYSLGALLFEVLTEQRAHQFKSYTPTEIERVVCHTEIEKPSNAVKRTQSISSKLQRILSGDLDNIVLMSMRKDVTRRYSSVEQFSEDIRRYLKSLPVIARSDTYFYRAGKFVGRHKWAITAVVLVIVSLLGGVLAAMYQARRAERRFQQVRKLANTFLFDFDEKIRDLPGSTEARAMVVKTALEYLDSLALEAEGDAALLFELAEAYEKVGNVQGSPYEPNLGDTASAIKSHQKALEIRKGLAASDPENFKVQRSLSMSYYNVGDLNLYSGKIETAIENYHHGLAVAEKLSPGKTNDPEDFRLTSRGYTLLGDAYIRAGKASEALQSYQKGLEITKQWSLKHADDRAERSLANSYKRVGDALVETGDLLGAVKSYQQSIKIREPRFRSKPDDPVRKRELVVVYLYMSDVLGSSYSLSTGDISAALKYLRTSLPMLEELVKADPKNAQAKNDLSVAFFRIGDLFHEIDPVESVEYLKKSLNLMETLLESSPQSTLYRRTQSLIYIRLAYPLRKLNHRLEAKQGLMKALKIQKEITESDPAHTQVRQDMIVTYNEIGDLLLEEGDLSGAQANYHDALKIAELMLTKASNSYSMRDLADCYERFGNYYATLANENQKIENCREAENWYQKSLKVWDDWPKHSVSSPFNIKRREQVLKEIDHCPNKSAI